MRAVVIAVALVALALPAAAQTVEIYHRTGMIDRPFDQAWPDDGLFWHQLQPSAQFCTWVEQTAHNDANGNGLIDVCESIQLGGAWRHIDWVGPTYTLQEAGSRRTIYAEYYDTMRQNHYEIVAPPEYEGWIITTNEPLDQECQYVTIEQPPGLQGEWHVVEICTNIHTGPGSPVEKNTWGKIKSFFEGLID